MKTLFRALLILSLAIPTALPIRLAAQDADPVAVLDARQRAFELRNGLTPASAEKLRAAVARQKGQ